MHIPPNPQQSNFTPYFKGDATGTCKIIYFPVYYNCRKQVQRSKVEAEKENIKVPTTVDEYCVKSRPSRSEPEDLTDFYDDDYADDVDDDDDDDECMDYSEDSGNEETWYLWLRAGTLSQCIFCTV